MVTPNLLRVDSAAALLAAAFTGLVAGVLSRWYDLPLPLLQAVALVNLAYGLFSGWLLLRPCPRPLVLIHTLVFANGAWACVCLVLAVWFFDAATWLGIGHLLLEAAFVGALAVAEWRQRRGLQTQP